MSGGHDGQRFAAAWIEDWNRRDVEAVLAHFREDCVFVSPKAVAITGGGTLDGKAALRGYWNAALARANELRFVLDRAVYAPDSRTLSIIYEATINGVRNRAVEIMTFDGDGNVARGEAFYGAPLP
jgi:ketosteroid isomerase-like protein